jgi:hypothetical protein
MFISINYYLITGLMFLLSLSLIVFFLLFIYFSMCYINFITYQHISYNKHLYINQILLDLMMLVSFF